MSPRVKKALLWGLVCLTVLGGGAVLLVRAGRASPLQRCYWGQVPEEFPGLSQEKLRTLRKLRDETMRHMLERHGEELQKAEIASRKGRISNERLSRLRQAQADEQNEMRTGFDNTIAQACRDGATQMEENHW